LLRHAAPEDPDVMTVADVPGDEPELLEVSVLNLDVIGAGQQGAGASEAPTTATTSTVRP
jgi:hypothetical protein